MGTEGAGRGAGVQVSPERQLLGRAQAAGDVAGRRKRRGTERWGTYLPEQGGVTGKSAGRVQRVKASGATARQGREVRGVQEGGTQVGREASDGQPEKCRRARMSRAFSGALAAGHFEPLTASGSGARLCTCVPACALTPWHLPAGAEPLSPAVM